MTDENTGTRAPRQEAVDRMPKRTLLILATACALLLVATSPPALASDYSDTCQSVDGLYVMDDGQLYAASAWRKGDTSKPIEHRKGPETVRAREVGTCIDWKRGGSKPIGYESKRYRLVVSFLKDGRPHDVELRCQLYADGQPASFSCDRRTVTSRIGEPERPEKGWGIEQLPPDEKAPVVTRWTHNGSLMELAAQGEARTISYLTPRTGLSANGVRPGSVLFNGTSDGRTYKGSARYFSARCGKIQFSVEGPIEQNGARITLRGAAPKLATTCRPTGGTMPQVLMFELRP